MHFYSYQLFLYYFFLKDHRFLNKIPSDTLHHHAFTQQFGVYTVGIHEGPRSLESSRLHVMVLLRNITQPCHKVLQIALTILSHNLKVNYIIEDRLEELQTLAIHSPEPHTLLYCKTRYLFINPADWNIAQ